MTMFRSEKQLMAARGLPYALTAVWCAVSWQLGSWANCLALKPERPVPVAVKENGQPQTCPKNPAMVTQDNTCQTVNPGGCVPPQILRAKKCEEHPTTV